MNIYLYAFIVAMVLAYLATPFVKKLAWRIGAVDIPRDNRRVHTHPIPRIGGLAIYAGFVAAVMLTLPFDRMMAGLLLGSGIIVILGIVDDIKEISPKVKLLGQIAAAVVLVAFGIQVEWVTNPLGGMFYLGKLSAPLTIFWVVGITNTLNFIDGLDGLAAGVASIASVTLLFVALEQGQGHIVILASALAGSALGFLPFNFNPAKIFMGDTGAMFLGFTLAAISIEGAIKSAATIALVAPVLALGLPIFDTAFAILRRLASGHPVMQADKGHIHHRLLALGLNQRQTVIIMYFISMGLGASAILMNSVGIREAVVVLAVTLSSLFFIARPKGVVDIKHNNHKFDV
jgi:UDP-GlcNAc:undecaprenyl-phosphate GlcNAc-1-phosphate transferase